MDGILLVYKPRKCGSNDVLTKIKIAHSIHRKKIKIGHGGTLDPEAEGLLVVGLGTHTKLLGKCTDDNKIYQTIIDLSSFTTTDDVEGDIQNVEIEHVPTLEDVQNVINKMIGQIEQVPSKYSAIKINGQRSYKLARSGEKFEMKSRIITIFSIKINKYEFPLLDITVSCSKGTYIRSIGRDIGINLGTGGHLAKLVRLQSGKYLLENALTLDNVIQLTKDGKLENMLIKESIMNTKPGKSNHSN